MAGATAREWWDSWRRWRDGVSVAGTSLGRRFGDDDDAARNIILPGMDVVVATAVLGIVILAAAVAIMRRSLIVHVLRPQPLPQPQQAIVPQREEVEPGPAAAGAEELDELEELGDVAYDEDANGDAEPVNMANMANMTERELRRAARKQEKREERRARAAALAHHTERRRATRAAADERERAADEERHAQERAEEEARQRKLQQDADTYRKWKGAIQVQAAGDGPSDLDDVGGEAGFLAFVRKEKVVMLEDLAARFHMRTDDAVRRLRELEQQGAVSGVFDDRGKFIFISEAEMDDVAAYIRARGRVAISELVGASTRLVKLQPAAG